MLTRHSNSVSLSRGVVWTGRRLLDLIFLVFLITAIAKLVDVPAFGKALSTWKYVPRSAITPLAYAVPLAELSLVMLWFLSFGRRTAVCGAAFLLILFTGAYLFHLRDPGPPPDCGCLGEIIRYESQQAAIGGLVGRNAILLTVLVLGAWLGRVFRHPPSAPATVPADGDVQRPRPRTAGAFTILEMIMVIAVVTLLVSLLMPALSGVRDRAKTTRSLSNLRSHATNIAAYTGDWGGVFPYITDPDDGEDGTPMVVAGREYRVTYWGATIVWPLGLLETHYGSNMAHPSLIEEEQDVAQPWGMWAYVYSSSFIARPEFWNPSTREGMHQLRPTRIQEVSFPSRKGIIVPSQDYAPADFETEYMGRPRWRIGFVDTSARIVDRADLLPGYWAGTFPFGVDSTWPGFPVTHTIDGVRGLDTR